VRYTPPVHNVKSAAPLAARLRVARGDAGTPGKRTETFYSALPQALAERNARSDITKCIFLKRFASATRWAFGRAVLILSAADPGLPNIRSALGYHLSCLRH
jgi:hypothetical protein